MSASLAHLAALLCLLSWAPPTDPDSDPSLGGKAIPDEGGGTEIDWLVDAPWAKVALLITVAVGVLVLANILMKGKKGRRSLRPRPDFDLRVAKLEQLPVTTIAAATAGPVHLVGTLRKGDGALGTGPRACVFQNRAGSTRATAIAAELVLLDDESGLLGLESLEQARVIAPREDDGPHDTIALYLGDRVEVVGELMLFDEPQTAGGEELRGMLGALGQIQVRVVERPEPSTSPADASAPESPAPDEDPQPDLSTDTPASETP